MAMIRSLPGLYNTYHDLEFKLFDMLPKGYEGIDIIADTYQKNSMKDPERNKRDTSAKVMVQSAQSKIPRNFSEFLKNGENKTRLIELIKSTSKKIHDPIMRMKCTLFSKCWKESGSKTQQERKGCRNK